jgi:hypothetical protein
VISYSYWKSRFGGEPSVLGKIIQVDGAPLTIIGVTPRRFFGAEVGRSPEVTVPITLQPEVTGSPSLLNNYLSYWVTIVARLKPGVTRQQAQANLAVVFEHA